MGLLWTDGMDRYGANADLALNYTLTNTPTYSATGGVTNAGYIQTTSGNPQFQRNVASTLTAGGTIHASFWVKWTALPSSTAQNFFQVGTNIVAPNGDIANTPKLRLSNLGVFSVTSHNATTTLASSSASLVTANTWYHIEYAAKYNTSGGTIKVWVNGNIVINFSGATASGTVPTTVTSVSWGNSVNDIQTVRFDDVIVWDEVGTDFALAQMSTAYLPVVETLSPDANDTVQFTPSTGSNFQNVDDPAFQNADVDYNSSSTVGQADQFTLANQATTPAYTFGVTLKTVARIDIAGTVNLRTRLVSGGTTTDSADRLLGTAYALYADYFGKDPATTAVWTTAQANNLKCGYKYQS